MNIAKRVAATAGLLAGLGLAFSTPVAANLVANGDFETGDLTDWTESGNTGFMGVDCIDGCFGSFAAFAGPVGSLGFLSQTLTTMAGQTYFIQFEYQNCQPAAGPCIVFTPNQMTVEWGGVNVFNVVDEPPHGYQHVSIPVLALGNSTILQFGFRQDPNYWELDNVDVSAPEPMSLALLGLGLGVLGLSRRRKQA